MAGTCSYGIYLIHHPILEAWPRMLLPMFPTVGIHPLLLYTCCLSSWAAILPIAMLMYRFLDLPAIALGKDVANALSTRGARFPALRQQRYGHPGKGVTGAE